MQKQWGVWITHDIDHIRVGDHYGRDSFLFRLLGVSLIEVFKGRRSLWSFTKMPFQLLQKNRWNHFDEWIKLEKKHNIPSTWFFAVNKGISLSYTREEIKPIFTKLKKAGFNLALHGQHYEGEREILGEYEGFYELTKMYPKGIRMHYLRMKVETFQEFTEHYSYDSSVFAKNLEQPKKTLHMLEIPIHIMDTYLFSPMYSNFTLEQAKKHTEDLLNKAKKKGWIVVFDIHPHHLDPMFPRHRAYILWLYERISTDSSCTALHVADIFTRYSNE
jgi:hypothetical protein